MIYISSSCIKTNKIEKAVRTLCDEGFKNIELSGGTEFDNGALNTLVSLQKEYDANFLLHNYFPTPQQSFVINLASLDPKICELSKAVIKKAIEWSVELGANKYAFHAGFLINIPLNEVGKVISKATLFNEKEAYAEFEKNLAEISDFNNDRVQLYIENNVLSTLNYNSFNSNDPFFFTSSQNLEKITFPNEMKILLDVAHLKVSCNSLSLNFDEELTALYKKTDYVHFSDNDGRSDSNNVLKEDSDLHKSLKEIWSPSKVLTIEVYSGMDDIKQTYSALQQLNEENESIEV
jgi:sugar phosphate isomerase/epimerase